MAFVYEYLTHAWTASFKAQDGADVKAWNDYLDAAEKDRQRE